MIAIIVTHNAGGDIDLCLQSLHGEAVMVIDNASRDGTAEFVAYHFPDVDLVPLATNLGLAAAVNIGLSKAAREDALILNPDVIVGDGALGHLASYLSQHPKVGIVAPLLVNPDGTPQHSIRRFPTPLSMAARRTGLGSTGFGRRVLARHLLLDHDRTRSGPVDWALGAALLVRRQAIDEVGGMDAAFFLYNEDIDWCFRMWKAGWAVHCCPDALMSHVHRRSSRSTFDLSNAATRHHWRSVVRLFVRHPVLLLGSTRMVGRPRSWRAP